MSIPSGSRATLKDVARESGVSSATVSFVLNRTSGQTISAATRERVLAAAARLGYTPHRIARALREGTSRTVLLSTGSGPAGHSLESFIDGLETELGEHGYTLLVVRGHRAGALPAGLLETIAPRAVLDPVSAYAPAAADAGDGAGAASDGADAGDGAGGASGGAGAADRAGVADWEGGWAHGLAAHSQTQLRYLVEQGHREIAVALPEGGPYARLAALRLDYARTAAAELGLPEPPVIRLGSDRAAAAAELRGMRKKHPGVSAIAAFNDDVAFLVLGAMADLELEAPADLAVIGFDESRYGALWRPALTTVRIDAAAYGRRAARGAIGLELGEWPSSPSRVVRRESA
ncbi:LacI family transcriptional regulator [Promicromonospora sp. AC04]|uniref:LacI family DNA-binding transcriptional regulator n=1 Tax=Promicromonospora sp. AC04 TaxID=2135723 RepID=UPI000D49C257|nr:LacI family DNA-binding transcriptional regulator [Promicromonospora sp. AC04]PUB19835.1 LacI family transcriptional regulator [Promicromonospora sp. AC04]